MQWLLSRNSDDIWYVLCSLLTVDIVKSSAMIFPRTVYCDVYIVQKCRLIHDKSKPRNLNLIYNPPPINITWFSLFIVLNLYNYFNLKKSKFLTITFVIMLPQYWCFHFKIIQITGYTEFEITTYVGWWNMTLFLQKRSPKHCHCMKYNTI